MSTPRSGSANLNITVEGNTTQYNPFGPDQSVNIPNRNAKLTIVVQGVDHDYQPGGADTTVAIPSAADVFIETPLHSNDGVTQIDEGTAGQAKYLKCMELLGDGQLPVACGRNTGPSGTHGSFGVLAYITNDCELCFYFQSLTVYDDNCLCKLTPAGVWYLMTM
jgi:hypothetical protein